MEKEFGERLKHFREMVGMTQGEFAEAVQISQPNVSMLERGGMKAGERKKNKPGAKVLEQIAGAFPNLNMNWLFYNLGKPLLTDKEKVEEISKNENVEEVIASYKEMLAMLNEQNEQLKADKEFLQEMLKKK